MGGPPLVDVLVDIAETAMVRPLCADLDRLPVTPEEEEAFRALPLTEEHIIGGQP